MKQLLPFLRDQRLSHLKALFVGVRGLFLPALSLALCPSLQSNSVSEPPRLREITRSPYLAGQSQ